MMESLASGSLEQRVPEFLIQVLHSTDGEAEPPKAEIKVVNSMILYPQVDACMFQQGVVLPPFIHHKVG